MLISKFRFFAYTRYKYLKNLRFFTRGTEIPMIIKGNPSQTNNTVYVGANESIIGTINPALGGAYGAWGTYGTKYACNALYSVSSTQNEEAYTTADNAVWQLTFDKPLEVGDIYFDTKYNSQYPQYAGDVFVDAYDDLGKLIDMFRVPTTPAYQTYHFVLPKTILVHRGDRYYYRKKQEVIA